MIQGSASDHLGDSTVVLGITGSVAAVQSVKIARELRRHGAVVKPVATKAALDMVGEQALQWACERPVLTGLSGKAEHLALAENDLLLVAPTTANTVAKIANGISDNTLTAVAAAFDPEKVVLSPAMHLQLYETDAYRKNIETLKDRGTHLVRPVVTEGAAKLPPSEEITGYTKRLLRGSDLEGKKIVVTGGTTAEPLDDIRIITTRASGKTGLANAREAYERGAEVTLVLGRGTVQPPRYIDTVRTETAEEMTLATIEALEGADVLISSAAISDHSTQPQEGKHPSDETLQVELEPVQKLIDEARASYPELEVVAFKAESHVDDEELLKAARDKLSESISLVAANDVSRENAGFESDQNEVLLVDEDSSEKIQAPKLRIAQEILNRLA